MTTLPISVQPIGDFQLSIDPQPSTAQIVFDLVIAPNGDIKVVTGIARLVQMVILWLLTPQGQNPFDPIYGNPFYAQLGRPSLDSAEYMDMLDACEAAFLTAQDQAAQAGQLSADEMVDHFTDNLITMSTPGTIIISFTIVARSGVMQSVLLPFNSTLSTSQFLNQ